MILQPTPGLAQTTIRVFDSAVAANENGATYRQRVWLLSQPTQNVTVQVSSSDTTVVTVNPTTLTFTPQNYTIAHHLLGFAFLLSACRLLSELSVVVPVAHPPDA